MRLFCTTDFGRPGFENRRKCDNWIHQQVSKSCSFPVQLPDGNKQFLRVVFFFNFRGDQGGGKWNRSSLSLFDLYQLV